MSVFRVKLANTQQGRLDIDPTTSLPFTTSPQRSISVPGPKGTHRRLLDGETFTDCNYWKQFAYPQTSLADAFIEVVTDDGSVYSTVEAENVYPVVWAPGDDGVIASGDDYDDDNMTLDIVSTYGSTAVFCELKNTDSSHDVKVKLNGSADAIFTLDANSTQIFNHGDLVISKIQFDNSFSGAAEVNYVEVILSLKSTVNS